MYDQKQRQPQPKPAKAPVTAASAGHGHRVRTAESQVRKPNEPAETSTAERIISAGEHAEKLESAAGKVEMLADAPGTLHEAARSTLKYGEKLGIGGAGKAVNRQLNKAANRIPMPACADKVGKFAKGVGHAGKVGGLAGAAARGWKSASSRTTAGKALTAYGFAGVQLLADETGLSTIDGAIEAVAPGWGPMGVINGGVNAAVAMAETLKTGSLGGINDYNKWAKTDAPAAVRLVHESGEIIAKEGVGGVARDVSRTAKQATANVKADYKKYGGVQGGADELRRTATQRVADSRAITQQFGGVGGLVADNWRSLKQAGSSMVDTFHQFGGVKGGLDEVGRGVRLLGANGKSGLEEVNRTAKQAVSQAGDTYRKYDGLQGGADVLSRGARLVAANVTAGTAELGRTARQVVSQAGDTYRKQDGVRGAVTEASQAARRVSANVSDAWRDTGGAQGFSAELSRTWRQWRAGK